MKDNSIYKFIFCTQGVVLLVTTLLALIISGYIYKSLSSKNSDTSYSLTLMSIIHENSTSTEAQGAYLKTYNLHALKNTLLSDLKEGKYIKKITAEQDKNIEEIISNFCKEHAAQIIRENPDMVQLTQAWLTKKNIAKEKENELLEFYMEQDKSATLLRLISNYLGVTGA